MTGIVRLLVLMIAIAPLALADEQVVVWEGKTFRAGDRVRVVKRAGTAKPNETGIDRELVIEAGRTGVMVRGEPRRPPITPGEPVQIVRVRWDEQEWTDWETGKKVRAPSFESTCHVSYLEVIEKGASR